MSHYRGKSATEPGHQMQGGCLARKSPQLEILVTANAAWNIWHFRRPVIAALLKDGHRVTVLAPVDASVSKLEAMGCTYIDLAVDRKGINPLRGIGLLRRFGAVFRSVKPDAILSFTIKNNIFGALAARRLRTPFIPNVSGLGTAFLSSSALRLIAEQLYRAAFSRLPLVFFQNEEDCRLFLDRRLIMRAQARVLPGSGIDLTHFAPADMPGGREAPTFLMISRILRDKGVIEYAEAARLVQEANPRVRFLLLGAFDTENRTAISPDTIQRMGKSHGIEYLGTCEDVREHIAGAHCIVLPSYREGAPRTLIEAAAMSRPLIASDVPGCRAVVEDGKNGFLCEVRDAESLADMCLRFLSLPREDQALLGRAGRLKMEREFDQEFVVAAYRAAIRDLVTQKSRFSEEQA